jgi:hypothetical protein
MSQRVLATENAKQAITKMESLLQGDMTAQLHQLQQLGTRLTDANVWDGPLAVQFRTGQWPQASKNLQNTITAVENVDKQVQTIIQNILHAGGAQ